ncbi:hypothetical protein M0R45_034968 [Rubus argutus]|uniref:Uncharacterized protein n=1 Tax=Rubus argutus TaxID=59490 RepID=A0AAW1VUQ8_RUBAR
MCRVAKHWALHEYECQFTHKSQGSSSISFTVPLPSVHDLRIRGFNIFIVYAISDNDDKDILLVVQEKQEHNTTNPNCYPCATGGDLSSSDEPLPETYLLSYKPDSMEDKDKEGNEEEAERGNEEQQDEDHTLAAATSTDGSNNRVRGSQKLEARERFIMESILVPT